ncbi:MAG: hypothetical protein GY807_20570 [Gammaproteobacteria bacterium]|nr:hypothetical protein [Gammaproteobacteria bacterium]
MAGRGSGFRHNDNTRKKIKAAQLINRLQKHIESDKPLMDASQVNAAKALLNKVLPDLKAVEHSGDPDSPIVHQIERRIVRASDQDG